MSDPQNSNNISAASDLEAREGSEELEVNYLNAFKA
jgi:hypothetical protein